MSDGVVFEGEEDVGNLVGNIQIVPGAPKGMLAWLVKNKVASNARQAEYILLGVAIFSVIAAIGFFFVSNPQTVPAQTPGSPGWPKSISTR